MDLSLTKYCTSMLPPQNSANVRYFNNPDNNIKTQPNMIDYCRFQSQLKAIIQKDNGKFNTAYNTTKISKAMRYSQLVR
jgi:hypothetical protein